MKILHIGNTDKFIPPFIEFIKENFDFSQHRFLLTGGGMTVDQVVPHPNVYVSKHGKKGTLMYLLRALVAMQTADKIILHGLFNYRIVQLLFLNPWLLKKCYWIVWGGDLYVYQLGKKNWKWKRNEYFRRSVIKNMGFIVSANKGDIAKAVEWYGFNGEKLSSVFYTSNIFQKDIEAIACEASDEVRILVGNSSTETNRHLEAFDIIFSEKIRNKKKLKIIAPLSYGDSEYRKTVIEYGAEKFGDEFIPLVNFMPYKSYLNILFNTDIVVFNHNRQQGFGNLVQLLGFGKKVYISRDSNLWEYFESIGVVVYDFEKFDIMPIEKSVALKNRKAIEENFSIESIVLDMEKVFY